MLHNYNHKFARRAVLCGPELKITRRNVEKSGLNEVVTRYQLSLAKPSPEPQLIIRYGRRPSDVRKRRTDWCDVIKRSVFVVVDDTAREHVDS